MIKQYCTNWSLSSTGASSEVEGALKKWWGPETHSSSGAPKQEQIQDLLVSQLQIYSHQKGKQRHWGSSGTCWPWENLNTLLVQTDKDREGDKETLKWYSCVWMHFYRATLC